MQSEFRTKFSHLGYGERFIFESERSMPHSGLATGPWFKGVGGEYHHVDKGGIHKVTDPNLPVILLTGGE